MQRIERERERCREKRERDIYIYIYALWSYQLVQFGGLIVINWSKFVFFKTLLVKDTINIGVSAHVCIQKLRAQILIVINCSKLALFWDPKLGPVNNPYMDQLITIKNGDVLLFCCLEIC